MSLVPEHIVVVGAGLAGLRTIEQLREEGHQGPITLIGAEQHLPYDRPPLSKQIIAGTWEPAHVALTSEEKLRLLGVTLRLGVAAVELEGTAVRLADGTRVQGDAVVLATGVTSRRLPGQPAGVHSLRTLDDAIALRNALANARSLLVIGAGFVGTEVASVAAAQGLEVTILEALPVPLSRALGTVGGTLCARLIRENGVNIRCGAALANFVDDHTVALTDGTTESADVVLVGIGGVPELSWLAGSGLDITNGIACDSAGRALGIPQVWAAGDVAAWECPIRKGHHRNEHWTSATEQAAIVARDILGTTRHPDDVPYFWSDQFGLKIQLVGIPDSADSVRPLHGTGAEDGPVKGTVLGYFTDERLVAVAGFGAPRHLGRYRPLVNENADLKTTLDFAAQLAP